MRTSLAALLVFALCGVPLLSSCGTCSGTVKTQVATNAGFRVTVHNNTATGKDATFCVVDGTRSQLINCDAGASYPKCSK